MNPAQTTSRSYLKLLKACVTLTLLAWLFHQIDLYHTTIRWKGAEWRSLFLVGLMVFFACLLINVLRWRILLSLQGICLSFVNLSIIYAKGAFLGSFVPGGVATGDVYRMYSLAQTTGHPGASISSVVLERVSGICTLLVLSLVALQYSLVRVENQGFQAFLKPLILVGGLSSLTIVGLLVCWRYYAQVAGWRHPVLTKIALSIETLPKYFQNKRIMVKVMALSLLLQLVVVWWTYVVAGALHVPLSFVSLSITVPLITLISLLPISLGGFGVREAGYVFFLVPFGVTSGEAVSVGFISVLIQDALRLASGALFLFGGKREFTNRGSW